MITFLLNPTNLAWILFAILVLCLLIQLYYIFFVYSKLAFYKASSHREDQQTYPPLSVIICAYNEQENLTVFLPKILQQDYPEFEVIVVNDCSSDDTTWVLQNLAHTYPQLKTVEIKEHVHLKHSKKFALTLGIKAAKYEYLVMTDADCEPQSQSWLKEIASTYKDETQIVLGYSPYFKANGLLNKLIRFETSHTAMSYLAYALKKEAYMGVGRNLSYRKSFFFQAKGFNSHMHIKSGDDDLFVNANATPKNVRLMLHPDSFMYSQPKSTWKTYYRQKARHSGASILYKKKHQNMLATQLVSALLFYIFLLVNLILFPNYWFITAAIYLVRLISQFFIFSSIYKKLAVKDLILWLPILDLLYYFYICLNGLLNRSRKQTTW